MGRNQHELKGCYLVPGVNPVKELLQNRSGDVVRILISENNLKSKLGQFINDQNLDSCLEIVSRKDIDRLCPGVNHQGIVAFVRGRELHNLKTYLKSTALEEKETFLLLDGIEDPHNFGAILRAAECFQVRAVVFTKRRTAALSPVAVKASAGASEVIDLVEVSNLTQAVDLLKKHNFWMIATECSTDSTAINKFSFPDRSAIIIGSEGKGVSQAMLKNTDFKIHIPMLGQIDSLNVSQATAVVMAQRASS